jgi:hypothetical protein
MDKTRVLVARYENTLKQNEIPLFRGAVINAMEGTANVLYHNHSGDSLVYHYPMIQYKRIAKCAAIVAVESGADALGQFLSSGVSHLHIGEREEDFKIADINANNYLIQVWDGEFDYRLNKWLPFNSENFAEYKAMDSLTDKVALMEKILTGNILSFAKGLGITLTSNVSCRISSIAGQRLSIYKGVKMMSFDIVFKTNVSLPNYIGLGKGVSLGFGTIYRNHKNED